MASTQYYIAACVNTRYGRAGIVLNGTNKSSLLDFADNLTNRIGYCGCDSFDEAVKRAGMMERNEKGAWGPMANDKVFTPSVVDATIALKRRYADICLQYPLTRDSVTEAQYVAENLKYKLLNMRVEHARS